jgi:alpha-methylacyl-CoA racemase
VTGPLEGLRVIELPAIGPVPVLAMLLADLGADVVRVDKLDTATPGLAEQFAVGPLGRGRRAVGIDLRTTEGAEVLLRLCRDADVLVEGFRPGVAERLGVGPEQVHAMNPRLVYGRMTGWGQNGPLATTAGHDITYLALTGLLHGIGPKAGPPMPPSNYVADFGGGSMVLGLGVLAAVLPARESGQGQVVDAAMIDGAGYLGSMTRALLGMGGWSDQREDNLFDGGAPNYRCYECSDGKYVAVGALEPQFWSILVQTLEADPATVPSPYDKKQWNACAQWLQARFVERTRDDWAELFAPLDACVAPVLTLAEAPDHPQARDRETFVDVSGARMPAPAPRFGATPGTAGPVAGLRSHTDEVLAAAGYDTDAITRLRAAGVVG